MAWGLLSTALLLGIYFVVVGLISGAAFAFSQLNQYWYFIVSLALGFGIQISLYNYLRQSVRNHNLSASGKTVAITGTTSTLSMISCCTHYLANIIPILGVAGALSVVTQYQKQFFWVGLIFNFLGILYISNRIVKFKKQT